MFSARFGRTYTEICFYYHRILKNETETISGSFALTWFTQLSAFSVWSLLLIGTPLKFQLEDIKAHVKFLCLFIFQVRLLLAFMAKQVLVLLSFIHCLLYHFFCQVKAWLLVLSAFQGNTFLMKCHLGVFVTSCKSFFHGFVCVKIKKKRKKSASYNVVVVTVPSTQNTREGEEKESPVLTDVSDVFNNGQKKHVFRVLLESLTLL